MTSRQFTVPRHVRRGSARATRTAVLLALVAACSDGPSATPTPVTPTPPVTPTATLLPGAASDVAVAAVPEVDFVPRPQDYRTGHSVLPGAPFSFNTATLAIKPGVTVGALNALLTRLGGTIVAGIKATRTDIATVIVVRFPSTTHAAMDQIMATLRAAPELEAASRDMLIGTSALTSGGAVAADWRWQVSGPAPIGTPQLGTWGLTAMRVPQVWNLNEHLRAESRTARVGVLDGGFDILVPDFVGIATGLTALPGHPHGTQVASVIGAKFGNADGIDGVNPFARLSLYRYEASGPDSVTTATAAGWGLGNLLAADTLARVVNVSLGYNWSKMVPSISTDTSAFARNHADQESDMLRAILRQRRPNGRFPVIIAAAGNDSGDSTQYASPFTNLALRRSFAPIITVEADSVFETGGEVTYVRSPFSNVGAQLSAPGSQVGMISNGNVAKRSSGTSYSAPYVAGVASLLLALHPDTPDPTESENRIRDVLIRTVNTARNRIGRLQVDAFAAMLDMDAIAGRPIALRRLLDVDDGTPDGNTRIDPFTKAIDTVRAVKRDTVITMADFRHFRDLLIPFDFPGLTSLDGDAQHPKKDANGDEVVTPVAFEGVSPHDDFNGDGQLSRSAVAPLAGTLKAQGPMTDLAVMQSLWEDTVYAASELPGLIASGDIHVGLGGCTVQAGERLRATVTRVAGGYTKQQFFSTGGDRVVFTVPAPSAAAYTVTLARMRGDSVVALRDTTVNATLGGDAVATHGCTPVVRAIRTIRITPGSATLSGGQRAFLEAEALDSLGRPITDRTIFYSWRDSPATVTSVSAGPLPSQATVTGLRPGFALIRAVAEGVSGNITVTVTTEPPSMPTSSATLGVSDAIGTVKPFQLLATGGVKPYTFEITRGSKFRNALTLSPAGVITGTCGECANDSGFTTRPGGFGLRSETVSIMMTDANGVRFERLTFVIDFQYRPFP